RPFAGLEFVKHGLLSNAQSKSVLTRVWLGKVGRTSMEFRYDIFFDSEKVAEASSVAIVVSPAAERFQPSPVPEDLRPLVTSSARGADPAECLRSIPDLPPSPDAYRVKAVVRFSDEDINKHANHSAQALFFEDAKEEMAADASAPPPLRRLAAQELRSLAIAYLAEAHAKDELTICLAPHGSSLDVWVQRERPAPKLLAKGRMYLASRSQL
ncbi:unnamed protein product, partial [Effrenium voratum]